MKLKDGFVMGEDWPATRTTFQVGDVVNQISGFGSVKTGEVIKVNPVKLRLRCPYFDKELDIDFRYNELLDHHDCYVVRKDGNVVHKLVAK